MDSLINLNEVIRSTPVVTREEILCREGAENWPEAAKELLLKETAPERHGSRVQRCFQVAQHIAREVTCDMDNCQEEIVYFLLTIGWVGVGGPSDLGARTVGGNRASARVYPWNKVCGKGRANASDGPAWCNALHSAGALLFSLKEAAPYSYLRVYSRPSSFVMALEAIQTWLPENNEVADAWVRDLYRHLRAYAGQQLLVRGEHRDLWADVYDFCTAQSEPYATMYDGEEVCNFRNKLQDAELELEKRREEVIYTDPAEVWRADDE